ncbi:MAG: transcriptional repressor [Phycisphaerales bacterium]|nr:transcriptional repressor [Phycisphaerales bacterium]
MSTHELFTRHSLRCTRQRIAIYEALRQCMNHPTAEELFRMVQSETRGLSRATVYNTLEALSKAGLVRQLATANGCCRYDADTSEHLHVRLRETAEIRDVPLDLGAQLVENLPASVLKEIERRMGIRIEGVNVQLLASDAA